MLLVRKEPGNLKELPPKLNCLRRHCGSSTDFARLDAELSDEHQKLVPTNLEYQSRLANWGHAEVLIERAVAQHLKSSCREGWLQSRQLPPSAGKLE